MTGTQPPRPAAMDPGHAGQVIDAHRPSLPGDLSGAQWRRPSPGTSLDRARRRRPPDHAPAHHPGHGLPAAHLGHRVFGQNFGWLVRRLDGPGAFVAYGIGGLAVPLALLAAWLRFRTPHTSTAPGADDHGPGFRAEPRRRTSRPL